MIVAGAPRDDPTLSSRPTARGSLDRRGPTTVDRPTLEHATSGEYTAGSAFRYLDTVRFPWPYLYGLAMVVIATAISVSLSTILPVDGLGLIFLMPVLFTALFFGYLPSLTVALASVLAFDYFLIPPLYSLTIGLTEDVVALGSFIVVAGIVSSLTSETRRQRVRLIERMHRTEDLLELSRQLGAAGSLGEIIEIGADHLGLLMGGGAALLLLEGDQIRFRAAKPAGVVTDPDALVRAAEAWRRGTDEGLRPTTGQQLAETPAWAFHSLRSDTAELGIVGLNRPLPAANNSSERRLLDGILGQVAVAIERAELRVDIISIRDREETERLRNAVLTSVSHDLRTPLSTVIGALSSLRNPETDLDPVGRDDLVGLALDEAKRLNQFIGNLLDISRVESGRLTARMEPVELGEAIGAAFERARPLLAGHETLIAVPADTPLVLADASLLEQVIFNLLDNAAKYAKAGTRISVVALPREGEVTVEVSDEGEGIAEDAMEGIFDKFSRLNVQKNGNPIGTGLGLSVCRGFMKVMGGTIWARNRADRTGAVISFTLSEFSSDQTFYDGALDNER